MKKIKQFLIQTIESEKGKDFLVVFIVILVGLVSFELGRLSKENSSSGIKILPAQAGEYLNQNTKQVTASAISANSSGKTFFASRKGSKYYTTSCSAGKTIKQENRVYFSTGEEAEIAGYTISSSCK